MNPAGSRDVFICGAGFSRAISRKMPLTDELGRMALVRLASESGLTKARDPFGSAGFEAWLSQLANEQPYLASDQNLDNQARYQRVSAAIADVLGGKVQEVLGRALPTWLGEFVRLLHLAKSTVITFNYDTLIECAVGTGLLHDWGRPSPVYWAEVIGDVPSWPPGAMRVAATPAETLCLLKLHGSLNWYWIQDDLSGASMARRQLPGVYLEPEPYNERERYRTLPGRVPFVVPPSASKSPYFRNPVVRDIWRQAAMALRSADRVFIVGYSIPPSDTTTGQMLRDCVAESRAEIIVVDPNANEVRKHLEHLGLRASTLDVEGRGSETHVKALVDLLRREHAISTASRVRQSMRDGASADDPILVHYGANLALGADYYGGQNRMLAARVESMRAVAATGEVVLRVGEIKPFGAATAVSLSTPDVTLPTRRLLVSLLARSDSRIRVVRPGGGRDTVVAQAFATTNLGYSERWLVLVPSATQQVLVKGAAAL